MLTSVRKIIQCTNGFYLKIFSDEWHWTKVTVDIKEEKQVINLCLTPSVVAYLEHGYWTPPQVLCTIIVAQSLDSQSS